MKYDINNYLNNTDALLRELRNTRIKNAINKMNETVTVWGDVMTCSYKQYHHQNDFSKREETIFEIFKIGEEYFCVFRFEALHVSYTLRATKISENTAKELISEFKLQEREKIKCERDMSWLNNVIVSFLKKVTNEK